MQSEDVLYLSANVQVEPLVDQWYAWPHLIPPATAARNLSERHLRIMDSYIAAPQVHAAAVSNPKMRGGPFIDYEVYRVEEIKILSQQTKTIRGHLLELSRALQSLDDMLRTMAKGYSLIPLYEKVPDTLRGYVELVYDLNNNPSFRLLEPLLYASRYYDCSAQSVMLSAINGDDRPFVLSTPRLPSERSVHLKMPFKSDNLDRLFQLKTHPRTWREIREILDAVPSDDKVLRSFFTSTPPPNYFSYNGKGVRWRYFGHACILVETCGTTFLFDPVLSYTYETNISRYTYEDLPPVIDYVIITHNHQDHILLETLLQLRHKVRNIIVPPSSGGMLQDPSIKLILKNIGFDRILELGDMESIAFEGGSITALPFFGEHSDLNIRSKAAYLARVGTRSLLFAADSCNVEPRLYEHIHQEVGDVDAVFLGMECDGAPLSWLYGPLLTRSIERAMDQSRRLSGSNYEQAMDIVNRFKCRSAFVYAMGQEPWLNYVMSVKYTEQSRPIVESNKLIENCKQRGIYAERLFGEREILLQ
jgi:L-ascorbate metabolism protein UlaG (beta-lactamase superfamily)